MSEIVHSLLNDHKIDKQQIASEIGANLDEVELLAQDGVFQVRGLADLPFSPAWVPRATLSRKAKVARGPAPSKDHEEKQLTPRRFPADRILEPRRRIELVNLAATHQGLKHGTGLELFDVATPPLGLMESRVQHHVAPETELIRVNVRSERSRVVLGMVVEMSVRLAARRTADRRRHATGGDLPFIQRYESSRILGPNPLYEVPIGISRSVSRPVCPVVSRCSPAGFSHPSPNIERPGYRPRAVPRVRIE